MEVPAETWIDQIANPENSALWRLTGMLSGSNIQ